MYIYIYIYIERERERERERFETIFFFIEEQDNIIEPLDS